MNLKQLGFNVRARNVLDKYFYNIHHKTKIEYDDLFLIDYKSLSKVKDCGVGTINHIRCVMDKLKDAKKLDTTIINFEKETPKNNLIIELINKEIEYCINRITELSNIKKSLTND